MTHSGPEALNWPRLAAQVPQSTATAAPNAVESARRDGPYAWTVTTPGGRSYTLGLTRTIAGWVGFCACPAFLQAKARAAPDSPVTACKHLAWARLNYDHLLANRTPPPPSPAPATPTPHAPPVTPPTPAPVDVPPTTPPAPPAPDSPTLPTPPAPLPDSPAPEPAPAPTPTPSPRPAPFTPAVKRTVPLRIALWGPSGSGKTLTALRTARALSPRIALIDSEHGSAALYADLIPFDILTLTDYAPQTYITAINQARDARYPVLIVDGLSQAWAGEGGVLEMVDSLAAQSRSRNTFQAWARATPLHRRLVETILAYPGHVIVTMRAKTLYEVDTSSGQARPVRVGLGPVQREGIEYEFDVVGALEAQASGVLLRIEKSRCPALHGKTFPNPDTELADILTAWLTT